MYVSRAVESIRDDPVPDADVTLVCQPDDGVDPDDIAAAVRDLDGEVERESQFGDVVATVPQSAVADVCAIEGLASVESENAVGLNPDEAEEDVDPDSDMGPGPEGGSEGT